MKELIELLTKAIAETYPQDAIRPGLLISSLRDGQFYVSIVRYQSHHEKTVVFKTRSHDLGLALEEISNLLLSTKPSVIDKLSSFIKSKQKSSIADDDFMYESPPF